MTIILQDAINTAQTFQELHMISQQMHPRLSYWGRQYMVTLSNSPTSYAGDAPIGSLVDRALQIIASSGHTRHRYPDEWIQPSLDLDLEIERIYRADEKNYKNCSIITAVTMIFRSFLATILHCTSRSYKDPNHHYKWRGLGHDSVNPGLDGHILEPRPRSGGRTFHMS